MKKSMLLMSSLLLFAMCGEDKEKSDKELINKLNSDTTDVSISQEVLDDIMQTLPSPNEIANIISKSKTGFNKEMMMPTSGCGGFIDKHSQALALGVYGVDMGYINMNDRTVYVLQYLECIRDVAAELKVDQFFDFGTLSRLSKNKNNIDSLIHVSTENFNKIDRHLRDQKRGDLSVLILIGSWIEGLHMYTTIAEVSPGEDIHQRIGEQKIIMDNVSAILDRLGKISYYSQFQKKLTPLKKAFDKVELTYEYKPPTMKEVDGQLVVEDNTKTIIKITPETLSAISAEIKKLRKEMFIK